LKTIPLTKGQIAIIDDEDYERISAFKWCCAYGRETFYGKRAYGFQSEHITVLLHRFILNAPKDMQVDHINGDGLDNRRANLRICTHADNQHNRKKQKTNTSGYKGVFWNKQYKKWEVQIRAEKKIRVGMFSDKEEAARAYDAKAKELHGEFARLNFA
jgi:hypothetical protein